MHTYNPNTQAKVNESEDTYQQHVSERKINTTAAVVKISFSIDTYKIKQCICYKETDILTCPFYSEKKLKHVLPQMFFSIFWRKHVHNVFS